MNQPCKPMMMRNQISDWEIGDAEFADYWVYLSRIHADLWSFYLHNIHRWWISMASGPVIRSRIEDWASAMQNGKTALFRCVRFVSMCFDIPPTTCRGFSMIFLGRCKASQLPNPWSGLLFETQLQNCLTNRLHAKPSKRKKIQGSLVKFTKRYVYTGCRCLNAPNVTYIMLFVG